MCASASEYSKASSVLSITAQLYLQSQKCIIDVNK